MKRLVCLLLILAVLLSCTAALAAKKEWEYQGDGGYVINCPADMQIYSTLEDEVGWNMDVIDDLKGSEVTGSTVAILVCYVGEDVWKNWMENGIITDERGNLETMARMPVDEPPVDTDTGLEASYALFRSGDGLRMAEFYAFKREGRDTDYVVICRYPANDKGKYSDTFHKMIETLGFADGSTPAAARGSFALHGTWEYDGYHTVIKDVSINKNVENLYWLFVESDVTKFKMEKLTWDEKTYKVKKAKQLYSRKKLTTQDVLSMFDAAPGKLPGVRIRALNRNGKEEIWYIGASQTDGSMMLLSETDVQILLYKIKWGYESAE